MNAESNPRNEALRIAGIVLLLLTPVWLFVTWSQADSAQLKQRRQIHQILQLHVKSLDHTTHRLQRELKAIHNFLLRHDTESSESLAAAFEDLASGLRADSDWVRAYQIVDNGIIAYCFPIRGNEAVLGADLRKHPAAEVAEGLLSVMRTGEPGLTGPTILLQGDIGMIMRGPGATPGNPLRTVAIVVILDQFFAEAGIDATRDSLIFAIRQGTKPPIIGASEVFDSNPETDEFRNFNQTWQLAAIPDKGWNQTWLQSAAFFGGNGAVVLGLAAMLTYFVALRQKRLTQSLSRRTEELYAAHSQLENDVCLLSAAESQLRFSEIRFRAMFEQAAIGVAVVDSRTMRFLQANRCAIGILGYPLPQLTEMTLSQIIHQEDLDSCTESLQRLFSGEIHEYSVEHRCVRPDESQIWVNQTVSRVSIDADAEPLLIALFEDIHHRKSIEQRLQDLADSLPGLLLYIDRSLVVQFVNKMGEKWHAEGLWASSDDMLGQHLRDVLSVDQFQFFEPWISRALNGESVEFVTPERIVNGAPLFRSIIFAPHLAEDGTVRGFFAMVTDITDRRRAELERDALERQLMEAQKMEAVGTLAGGIAHDFNNMLQVILGYSDILLMQKHLDPVITEQLTAIRSAARRSAELTHQLLAFARQQSTAPGLLKLDEAVPRMLRLMRRVVSEQIELTWNAPKDLWRIYIDPAQWDQIVANLIVNSRDAIDGTGKIKLSARNQVTTDSPESIPARSHSGERVIFSISDTGCGIDEATQARIFEPFFTTKDLGKGTGLGLSTVYGIVHKHEGTISVTSAAGMGTTIEISFPRCEVELEHSSPGLAIPAHFTGAETILLVEDEPLVLDLGRSLLKTLGYSVIIARSAAEAIRIAEETVVHLLITDVIMPDMNGRDLASAIEERQKNVQVLYISGFASDVVQRNGIHDPESAFLQKPFSPGELANRVRDLLAG